VNKIVKKTLLNTKGEVDHEAECTTTSSRRGAGRQVQRLARQWRGDKRV